MKKKSRITVRSMRKPAARTLARYDDALPIFTALVLDHLGKVALERNCFLRDADGNLTFVVRSKRLDSSHARLAALARKKLGSYVTDMPIATPDELMDDQLRNPKNDRLEYVTSDRFAVFVRLIERRIVGQDWIRGIWPPIKGVPPIIVFASQKGGVGRSTALAIAATHLASRGYSVLSIDADLEAPGLGEMFIPEDKQPVFGALDYFVENGRGKVDARFLSAMCAPSLLKRGKGQVLVVPAVGKRCREFPQNVTGKISRAYLDDVSSDGKRQLTFLEQMRDMIKDLCRQEKFDAVFVDARAGLNETTAATVQGLGADVLFFGVDTPQTWDGYRYFLAHLARFKPVGGEIDWRFRLKMVHAKATENPKALAAFRDNAFELFAEHLYDEIIEDDVDRGPPFGFDLDDQTAPHHAWPIMMDRDFFEFDPLAHPDQLTYNRYGKSFGRFISSLSERLDLK